MRLRAGSMTASARLLRVALAAVWRARTQASGRGMTSKSSPRVVKMPSHTSGHSQFCAQQHSLISRCRVAGIETVASHVDT